jgi:thiol-disulfide isomerase/thioredoxin
MKIVMFSQQGCAPCRHLEPHLAAAATQLGYSVEVVDIAAEGSNWSRYKLKHTPTVFVLEDDGAVIAELQTTNPKVQAPNALAIKAELEQHV